MPDDYAPDETSCRGSPTDAVFASETAAGEPAGTASFSKHEAALLQKIGTDLYRAQIGRRVFTLSGAAGQNDASQWRLTENVGTATSFLGRCGSSGEAQVIIARQMFD
jgi:hypothetical protein